MSFLKKIGDVVKDTATTVGSKSADMLEAGKLKLHKSQLEGKIKDKKTEIGGIVYEAYKKQPLKRSFAPNAAMNHPPGLNSARVAANRYNNIQATFYILSIYILSRSKNRLSRKFSREAFFITNSKISAPF